MANRTVSGAVAIHGSNPQLLVEKIIRQRIYESLYWKEECFGLTAELLVDKAVRLDHVGGVFGGNQRPTPFLCLLLKMLQLQPDLDIVLEFIHNTDYKYLRVLGATYYRLVAPSIKVYQVLEPLLTDYRKIRQRTISGFMLTYVDEVIDALLREDRVFDIILPRLTKRHVLEQTEDLPPYVSPLEDQLRAMAEQGLDDDADEHGENTDAPVSGES